MSKVLLKNKLNVYYESYGEAEDIPVIMVQGLHGDHTSSIPVTEILLKDYKVYSYDARGTGQTEYPKEETMSIEGMAEDLALFMEAINVSLAHIVAISMGGLVAQEFTLRYPRRVKSLTCLCTASSGPDSYTKNIVGNWGKIVSKVGYADTLESMFNWVYTPEFYNANSETMQQAIDQVRGIEHLVNIESFQQHTQALVDYKGCYDRVGQISCPTLVMSGSKDILVTPEKSKELGSNISNAKVVIIENEAHGFVTDAANKICVELLKHLEQAK